MQNDVIDFVNRVHSFGTVNEGSLYSVIILVKERIEFSIGKLAYYAFMHAYLLLQVKKASRVVRSTTDGALKLEYSSVEGSFQYNAAKVFNSFPENLKSQELKQYKNSEKDFIRTK